MMRYPTMLGAFSLLAHFQVVIAAATTTAPAAPAGTTQCAPHGAVHYLCGMHHPEDLVQVPGTPWILVSGMGGSLPGSPPGGGDLYLLNSKSLRWHPIAEASLQRVQPNPLYGDCAAPDAAQFVTHGLAIRKGEHGRHTLYAVNHGGRESVEIFSIDARGSEPQLSWTGCAEVKESVWLNSVTPLPGDSFIVTSTFDPHDAQARDKMGRGEYAGAVFEWRPGRGYAHYANAAATGDNGVTTSPDGRWVYFNWFFGHEVLRVAADGSGAPSTVMLDFLPDNIGHAPDGSLLVTGQVVDPKNLMGSCSTGDCAHDTKLIRLDPATLRVQVLAQLPANETYSDGTSAVQVGNTIFMGSYHGDAVAYMKAPH
jgi:hypothetical protein